MSSLDFQAAGKVGLSNTLVPIWQEEKSQWSCKSLSWLQHAWQNLFLFDWSMAHWNEILYSLWSPVHFHYLELCYCSSAHTNLNLKCAQDSEKQWQTHKSNAFKLLQHRRVFKYPLFGRSGVTCETQWITFSPRHKGSGSSHSLTPPHAPNADVEMMDVDGGCSN